jgi:hypothetical protein
MALQAAARRARPGGTYESSPAIYRRVRDPMGRVPEGRPNTAARSIPKISFFKADTVFLEKTDRFFLEASEPMMLHLILEIGDRFRNMRDTDPRFFVLKTK